MDFLIRIANILLDNVVPALIVLTAVVFVHEMGHFLVARLVRHPSRSIFDRLRSRALRVQRPPRHAVEDLRDPTWRLCALRRRRQRREHPRSGDACRDPAVGAQGALSLRPDLEAHPRGGGGTGGEFRPRDSRLRGPLHSCWPAAHPADRRYGHAGERGRARRHSSQATASSASTAAGSNPSPTSRASSCSPPTRPFRSSSSGTGRRSPSPPRRSGASSPIGWAERSKIGVLGITAPEGDFRRDDPLTALAQGARETVNIVDRTLTYIGRLLTGRESAEQLSGPIRIGQVSGAVVSSGGIAGLIYLAAVLSVSIGLFNLFPVPMLDGGHLFFYLIEAVRGRPLSPRVQDLGFRIGFALVDHAFHLRDLQRHREHFRNFREFVGYLADVAQRSRGSKNGGLPKPAAIESSGETLQ